MKNKPVATPSSTVRTVQSIDVKETAGAMAMYATPKPVAEIQIVISCRSRRAAAAATTRRMLTTAIAVVVVASRLCITLTATMFPNRIWTATGVPSVTATIPETT